MYAVDNGQASVLLVHGPGKKKQWTIPQIIVSADEDFEDAAAHELAEEAGVAAKELNYLGFVDYPKRRLHCFYGEAKSHKAPHSSRLEIVAAQFVPLAEANQFVDKRLQQLLTSLRSILSLLRETA